MEQLINELFRLVGRLAINVNVTFFPEPENTPQDPLDDEILFTPEPKDKRRKDG